MSGMARAGLLTLLLLSLPATTARAVDEKRVNAAIEQGVWALKRMQRPDGQWLHSSATEGATALAALTLLECDVPPDDPSIRTATRALREAAPGLTGTYSISLSILFFDRLGDPADIPLIESLMVRLLAGQQKSGSWTYNCPPISSEEINRLRRIIGGGRELATKPGLVRPTGDKKREVKDLSPEIRRQLETLAGRPAGAGAVIDPMTVAGDNSNTQFAVLALWVGRRYGLPIEGALARINLYFRTQQKPDGGWAYSDAALTPREPGSFAMTCGGLLGLAVAHGLAQEKIDAIEEEPADPKTDPGKDPKAPPRLRKVDPKKDPAMRAGMQFLSLVIAHPAGARLMTHHHGPYYPLWSLERVAVALDIDTVGGKKWYDWGANIILATQNRDGSWNATPDGPAPSTSLALLFLKRANLATDLTTRLRGKVGDLAKELRSGGVGGDALKGGAVSRLPAPPDPPKGGTPGKPADDKPGALPEETEAARLANEVIRAPDDRRGDLLERLSSTRGTENTQALREVIARAEEEVRQKARNALTMRFTRLKATTLTVYLEHEDGEYRQAAALALGMKDSREQVPDLIRALSDREPGVVRAARAALKAITRQDFGPEPGATRAEQASAIAQWERWWARNRGS